ncbi:MAG TPA: DUF2059 domain-containing protein [bacterium]
MRQFALLALLLVSALPALAQPADTPAARQKAAQAYVNESGLQQVVSESAKMVGNSFTPQERPAALASYDGYLNKERIRTVMVNAMAQRFTVEEIEAIRKFAASPAGKSVMTKLGAYAGDISPTIENASADAMGKVLLEMRRKSKQAQQSGPSQPGQSAPVAPQKR